VALKELLTLCKRASRDVLVDKGFTNAAAIAYYAIVSLFPLPFFFSVVGFLLKDGCFRHQLLLGRQMHSTRETDQPSRFEEREYDILRRHKK
jgi:hypothetical protein